MGRQLHILNGDGTAEGFQQSGVEGDVAIWREIFCEGPTGDLTSAVFWEKRAAFLQKEYPNAPKNYQEFVLSEIAKISNFQAYDEIILWFEHDLFCQLNLIGLLSWFAQQDMDALPLSMVCIAQHTNHDPFYGLGQLSPHEFPPLLQKRTPISPKMLVFAQQVWEAYSHKSPLNLLHLVQESDFTDFPYLKHALQLQLSRFPTTKTGLNALEARIMILVHEQPACTHKQIMRTLLKGENQSWGFGDLQYDTLLKNLSPLIEETEGYRLNALGEQVRIGEKNFMNYRTHQRQFGGSFLSDWLWEEGTLFTNNR